MEVVGHLIPLNGEVSTLQALKILFRRRVLKGDANRKAPGAIWTMGETFFNFFFQTLSFKLLSFQSLFITLIPQTHQLIILSATQEAQTRLTQFVATVAQFIHFF